MAAVERGRLPVREGLTGALWIGRKLPADMPSTIRWLPYWVLSPFCVVFSSGVCSAASASMV